MAVLHFKGETTIQNVGYRLGRPCVPGGGRGGPIGPLWGGAGVAFFCAAHLCVCVCVGGWVGGGQEEPRKGTASPNTF